MLFDKEYTYQIQSTITKKININKSSLTTQWVKKKTEDETNQKVICY